MLYPFKFRPILKERIWGGSKLVKLLGKNSSLSNIGESWDISGLKNNESVVSNGLLAGNNITELIETYGSDIVGNKVFDEFGETFPLLFKLIDANDNLSIQVHPDNKYAKEHLGSYGKSELWYIADADEGAELIAGFSEECSQEEYVKAVEGNYLERLLQKFPVSKGDAYYIPAGMVHSIGKGMVIVEIQQSSDETYRIYDFNREDKNGEKRELHTEKALEVINFSASTNPKLEYKVLANQVSSIIKGEHFTINILKIDQATDRNYDEIDSFVAYVCLEGSLVVRYKSEKIFIQKGESFFKPASVKEITMLPESQLTLLETFL